MSLLAAAGERRREKTIGSVQRGIEVQHLAGIERDAVPLQERGAGLERKCFMLR